MRTCTICRHPERDAINAALISREPYRPLAARTGTTSSSLRRHKAGHLPVTLTKAVREAEVVQAGSLLGQLEVLQRETLDILAKSKAAGDFRTALFAIHEARETAVLQERVLEAQREEASPARRFERGIALAEAQARELRQHPIEALMLADLETRNQMRAATIELIEALKGQGHRPEA